MRRAIRQNRWANRLGDQTKWIILVLDTAEGEKLGQRITDRDASVFPLLYIIFPDAIHTRASRRFAALSTNRMRMT
ncbi:hypothetical protein RRSWK_00318 [Rhodopirellula sp. SWK7]|nr:hypothetical protein RRSWK_00318 [Rhodopirellula sp. SWK7]